MIELNNSHFLIRVVGIDLIGREDKYYLTYSV